MSVRTPRNGTRRGRRRGTALFAVLFLVIVAALSAASMLTATAAERTATVRSVDELELRLAVRSALAVATVELARQRDAMLIGETPEAPGRLRIDRGENEPGIVVELVAYPDGRTLLPEAARLDLNAAPAESLRALRGMPEGLADAIVRERSSAPLRSPAEALLLRAEGATGRRETQTIPGTDAPPSGPADTGLGTGLTTADLPVAPGAIDAPEPDDRGIGVGPAREPVDVAGGFAGDPFEEDRGARADAWMDLVTVFGADPQVAIGAADPERAGEALINLNAPWSDVIELALTEAIGESGVLDDSLRTLFVDAPRLEKPSVLLGLLIDKGIPRERWGALLDAVTTTPDPFRLGLVDLNRAPVGVLAALPGLDRDAAEAIADARERLELDARLSVLWPLDEGIVDETRMRAFVDFVCVRTMQWRFRLRAAFEDEADSFVGFDPDDAMPDLLPEADEFGVAIDEEDERTGPGLEFEVVLDLADPAPRVAYLRERTAHGFAETIARLPGFVGDFGDEPADGAFGAEGELEDSPFAADLSFDDEISPFEGMEPAGLEDGMAFDPADDPFGVFGEDDEGEMFGLDLGTEDGDDARADRSRSAGRNAGDRGRVPSSGSGGAGRSSSGDNRLGRWAPARDGGGG